MNTATAGNADTDLSMRSDDGPVVVRDVMAAVFYSRTTNEQLRDRAAAMIRRIVDLLGYQAFALYVDLNGNEQDLTPATLEPLLDQRLLGRLRAPNANMILSSVDPGVPSFYLWYNGRSLRDASDPQASYLTLWVPRGYFAENSAELLALFDDIATAFPVSSGYVNRGFAGTRHLLKSALAHRYLAYDIASPLCVSADIGPAAAGAYWLNYLGKDLARRLGDPQGLRPGLADETSIRGLSGEVLRIQLTREATAGDAHHGEDLSAYRKFAAVLAGAGVLHVPSKAVYFFDVHGMADRNAMIAWHRRFID